MCTWTDEDQEMIREREVLCHDGAGNPVSELLCAPDGPKPATTQSDNPASGPWMLPQRDRFEGTMTVSHPPQGNTSITIKLSDADKAALQAKYS